MAGGENWIATSPEPQGYTEYVLDKAGSFRRNLHTPGGPAT
jgi:hypothetical protein